MDTTDAREPVDIAHETQFLHAYGAIVADAHILNAAAAGKIDQDLPVDERGKARHSVAQLIREENIRLDGKRIKALHLPEQYFADAVRIAVDRSFHSLYCSMRQIISQFPG